ncbi:DUF4870 domain-containing protein [Nocardioides sp.]|uniref:DUF4870 domain-containing protein n=1 Tax=Nocardioides sp. TaxID=35761 RepID=UPI003567F12F
MSDPTQPPHHGDEPPRFPPGTGGPFGMPPVGPSQSGHHQGQAPGQQPPPPPAPPGQQWQHPSGRTPDEITWGGAAHWSALVAAFVALSFLGPLVVLLTKGNESAYVRRQAVESLNFQLSILIYGVVSFVLVFVAIGILLLLVVGVLWLVFTILGSVKASQGEEYRYPLTIRMVS